MDVLGRTSVPQTYGGAVYHYHDKRKQRRLDDSQSHRDYIGWRGALAFIIAVLYSIFVFRMIYLHHTVILVWSLLIGFVLPYPLSAIAWCVSAWRGE